MTSALVMCQYSGSVWCGISWLPHFTVIECKLDGDYVPVRFTPAPKPAKKESK